MFLIDDICSIVTGIIDEPIRFVNYHIGKTIKAIHEMRGNAWVMVWTTFFWSVPGAWIGVYANIYMVELGVKKVEVGMISSLALLVQLFTIIWGGYLADRYGRKKLVMVLDVVTWIRSEEVV
jgi:nitrate/nitrite transporter NarK